MIEIIDKKSNVLDAMKMRPEIGARGAATPERKRAQQQLCPWAAYLSTSLLFVLPITLGLLVFPIAKSHRARNIGGPLHTKANTFAS